MAADKRNTAVVVALILSLTVGARLLLWLEPGGRYWDGKTLLMAERGTPVQEVEIAYASLEEAEETINQQGPDSVCALYPNGKLKRRLGGPRWQLIVVGSEADTLGKGQKEKLLAVLGSLNHASSQDLIRVRLAPGLQERVLPPQAADLRELLARKELIK
ncbi:MAG: hypothetical protein KAY37_03495 [Phycisphaerae bacterium]|nr:hypothetical protein [Phycisphaerae bacterium]